MSPAKLTFPLELPQDMSEGAGLEALDFQPVAFLSSVSMPPARLGQREEGQEKVLGTQDYFSLLLKGNSVDG